MKRAHAVAVGGIVAVIVGGELLAVVHSRRTAPPAPRESLAGSSLRDASPGPLAREPLPAASMTAEGVALRDLRADPPGEASGKAPADGEWASSSPVRIEGDACTGEVVRGWLRLRCQGTFASLAELAGPKEGVAMTFVDLPSDAPEPADDDAAVEPSAFDPPAHLGDIEARVVLPLRRGATHVFQATRLDETDEPSRYQTTVVRRHAPGVVVSVAWASTTEGPTLTAR